MQVMVEARPQVMTIDNSLTEMGVAVFHYYFKTLFVCGTHTLTHTHMHTQQSKYNNPHHAVRDQG